MGKEFLTTLNPQQRRAVETINGPVLVLAGAGTGKTRVITCRIAHMIDSGIDPKHILGLTFTNKAAREMRERLAQLISPETAKHVTLGTFHSFCMQILRREIKRLGYLPGFTIADESDQQGFLKQAAGAIGIAKGDISLPDSAAYISRMKNALLFPTEAKKLAENDYEVMQSQLYGEYQSMLQLQNAVDFDDLLLLTYSLFERFPEVLEKYRNIYRYLLIDEYQDTNAAQFTMVKMLAGAEPNICVVGDDDQSIYGWRGADVSNILDFPRCFPGTTEIMLEQNYRSTDKILQAANAVISGNPKRYAKKLWSASGEGEDIIVARLDDGEAEADFLVGMIQQERSNTRNLAYSDFAVLYRSNHLSRQIEQTFRRAGIPYKLVGGQEFFKRREIKDAASYLKLLVNPREDQSLLRILSVPPRGLADKAVEKLKELHLRDHKPMTELLGSPEFQEEMPAKAAANAAELADILATFRKRFDENSGPLVNLAHEYLDKVGYLSGLQRIYKDIEDAQKRRENIDEFLNAIAQYEAKSEEKPTLGQFLENFALLEENDRTDDESENGDGVILSTVHAAKGLEFTNVFIIAAEDNIFPHERALEENSLDEELRLFYVAITRARCKLCITCAAQRLQHGRTRHQLPSRFLTALPEEITHCGERDDFLRTLNQDELTAAFANIFAILKD